MPKSTTTRKKRMAMAVAAGSMAAAASLASVGSASAATTVAPPKHTSVSYKLLDWRCCGVPADFFTHLDPGDLTIPGAQIRFGV